MGALRTRTPLVCKFLVISLIFLVGLSSISRVKAGKKFHVVGDSGSWGFESYDSWASSRSFAAGDIVVFKYYAGAHDTVRVSSSGYGSCQATETELTKAMSTGNDMYSLKTGDNYFICSYGGHCGAGMKVKIVAK